MARLDKFAADADKMTRKLRSQGVEAYQFHDRSRSLVTIGSFDTLGRELPDGRFEYDAEIRKGHEGVQRFQCPTGIGHNRYRLEATASQATMLR